MGGWRNLCSATAANGLVAVFVACIACQPVGDPRTPNVILIVVDDLGLGQVSAYAEAAEPATPNIDRIAARGVRFTDGYSASPICLPSRASILTGQYHQRFPDPAAIPKQNRMISHFMRDAGYATAFIGKWHQGVDAANHPMEWGFDEFFGFLGGLHDYRTSTLSLEEFRSRLAEPMGPARHRKTLRYSPVLDGHEEVPRFRYLTHEFTDRALDFIERSQDRPFFLYLSYNAVHPPLQAPERMGLTRNEDPLHPVRARRRMIEVLDEGIGRILDVIEAEGLQQDTVVVFVSDNGGEDLFGGGRANGDLRGGKGTYTEGGIRVPFMIAWPRELPQGTVYTDPVMTIDILPTLAAMVGLRADELDGPDGVNLLPHLAGVTSAPPHTRLFWSNSGSIESDGRVGRAIRQGAWKGLWDRDDERWSLYDLGADPAESSDLSDARPELVEELARTHARWQAEVTAARSAAVDRGP